MTRRRSILADLYRRTMSQSGPERTGSGFDHAEMNSLLRSLTPTAEAQDRGLRILKDNLSPKQRAQYEKRGYFIVVGGETGRRYRIFNGCQMNVEQLSKKGRPMRVLCFMPKGDLVMGDVMLAQKMALELFESDALKVAIESPC
jgi:hypothetical protein